MLCEWPRAVLIINILVRVYFSLLMQVKPYKNKKYTRTYFQGHAEVPTETIDNYWHCSTNQVAQCQ